MYRHHSVYMVSVQAIFSQANTEGNTETKMLTGDEIMIYIQLFLSFVQIGLFSVGGGYLVQRLDRLIIFIRLVLLVQMVLLQLMETRLKHLPELYLMCQSAKLNT